MRRQLTWDVLLDEWPAGRQGSALKSLIDSGDVVAERLPRGFVRLMIVPTQMLLYEEAGRMHVRQIIPSPPVSAGKYRRTGTGGDRQRDVRL